LGQINWDNWVIGFFVKNPNYPITQLIVLRTLVLSLDAKLNNDISPINRESFLLMKKDKVISRINNTFNPPFFERKQLNLQRNLQSQTPRCAKMFTVRILIFQSSLIFLLFFSSLLTSFFLSWKNSQKRLNQIASKCKLNNFCIHLSAKFCSRMLLYGHENISDQKNSQLFQRSPGEFS
jgi:hypothetical protein